MKLFKGIVNWFDNKIYFFLWGEDRKVKIWRANPPTKKEITEFINAIENGSYKIYSEYQRKLMLRQLKQQLRRMK